MMPPILMWAPQVGAHFFMVLHGGSIVLQFVVCLIICSHLAGTSLNGSAMRSRFFYLPGFIIKMISLRDLTGRLRRSMTGLGGSKSGSR